MNNCLNVFKAVAEQLKIPHWGCPSWFYWAGPSGTVCADWDSEGAAHIPITPVVPGGIQANNSETNDAACKTINNIGITLNHFSSALCSSSTNKSVALSKNSHSSEQFGYSTYSWPLPTMQCKKTHKLWWTLTLERRPDCCRASTPKKFPNKAFLIRFCRKEKHISV